MVKPVTMIGYWHWFAINHVDFWNITSQVSRIHNLTVLFGPKLVSRSIPVDRIQQHSCHIAFNYLTVDLTLFSFHCRDTWSSLPQILMA